MQASPRIPTAWFGSLGNRALPRRACTAAGPPVRAAASKGVQPNGLARFGSAPFFKSILISAGSPLLQAEIRGVSEIFPPGSAFTGAPASSNASAASREPQAQAAASGNESGGPFTSAPAAASALTAAGSLKEIANLSADANKYGEGAGLPLRMSSTSGVDLAGRQPECFSRPVKNHPHPAQPSVANLHVAERGFVARIDRRWQHVLQAGAFHGQPAARRQGLHAFADAAARRRQDIGGEMWKGSAITGPLQSWSA